MKWNLSCELQMMHRHSHIIYVYVLINTMPFSMALCVWLCCLFHILNLLLSHLPSPYSVYNNLKPYRYSQCTNIVHAINIKHRLIRLNGANQFLSIAIHSSFPPTYNILKFAPAKPTLRSIIRALALAHGISSAFSSGSTMYTNLLFQPIS